MRQFGAILLLFLFSFSMMSFKVKLHYCKGNFKSLAFLGEANCGTCKSHQTKHSHCKKHQSSAPCCETIIVSHDGATDYLSSILINIEDQNDSFIVEPLFSELRLDFNFLNESKFNYYIHPPPDYEFDFQAVFQTYLI